MQLKEADTDIVQVTSGGVDKFAGDLAGLRYAAGPVTQDWQFLVRAVFDRIAEDSRRIAGSQSAFEACRLAVEGDELLGLQVVSQVPEFKLRNIAPWLSLTAHPVWNAKRVRPSHPTTTRRQRCGW